MDLIPNQDCFYQKMYPDDYKINAASYVRVEWKKHIGLNQMYHLVHVFVGIPVWERKGETKLRNSSAVFSLSPLFRHLNCLMKSSYHICCLWDREDDEESGSEGYLLRKLSTLCPRNISLILPVPKTLWCNKKHIKGLKNCLASMVRPI